MTSTTRWLWRLCRAATCGVFLLLASAASAQRVDSTFWADVWKYAVPDQVLPLPDSSCLVLGRHLYTDGRLTGNLMQLRPDGTLNQDFQQQLGALLLSSSYYTGQRNHLLRYPDGRILVVAPDLATVANSAQPPARLLRLLPSGRPDSSLVATARNIWPFLRAVALQPDGKVLLGGSSTIGGPLLIRLQADGQLDASFAPVLGSGSNREYVSSVVVQPDGRLLVAGFFGTPANALVRLLPSGQLDASFQASVAAGHNVQQLLLRPDGRVVVGGPASLSVQGRVGGVQQLLANGQRDPTFQAPATLGVQLQPADSRLSLQADGQLLVLSSQPAGGPPLVRLLASGTPDPAFHPSSFPLLSQQIAVDARGRLLLAGPYTHQPGPAGPLLRLLPSGARDALFLPQLYSQGRITDQLRLPDGRVVVVGEFDVLGNARAGGIGCLLPSGLPDSAFVRHSPFLNGIPERLAWQPGGRVLVAGSFRVGSTTRGTLVRLHLNGRLDTTFQRLTSGYPAYALATQADGRILLGGPLELAPFGSYFTRLLPDGQPDYSFQISGGLNRLLGAARHVIVQPDGRIVLAGRQVHRVLSSGQLDASYQATELNAYNNLLVRDMVLQANGQLTLCGQMPVPGGGLGVATVARLLASGRLDTTFRETLRGYFSPRRLLYQADGRLLVGGYFESTVSNGAVGLLRLLPGGATDATWPFILGFGDVASIGPDAAGRVLLGGNFLYAPGPFAQQLSLVRLTAGPLLSAAVARPAAGLALYPNPARGQVRVEWSATDAPRRVRIVTALGQLVQEQLLSPAAESIKLNVADLRPGMYLVSVETKAGTRLVQRLVVE